MSCDRLLCILVLLFWLFLSCSNSLSPPFKECKSIKRVFFCGESFPYSWVTFWRRNDTGILLEMCFGLVEVPGDFSFDPDVFVGEYGLEKRVK